MSVYSGDARFVYDYFQSKGNDFVIPEYQREYAWGKENVLQLFLDLKYGVNRLKASDTDAIKKETKSKFLGCIIQWNREAVENKDYHPSTNKYVDNIREIIDGQQRTSTILLIFIQYYYYFEKSLSQLNSSAEEKLLASFIKRIVQKTWTFNQFAINVPPKSDKKYRPALIRQETDKWYKDEAHALYESPITGYIFSAIQAIMAKKTMGYLRDISTEDSNCRTVINSIDEAISNIQYWDGCSLESSYSIEDLFGEEFSEDYEDSELDILQYIESNEDRKTVLIPIINNISNLHYLLNYCAFTVISSPTEESALDMFQSLNSSGVQLTAIQMLKPNLTNDFKKNNMNYSEDNICVKINEINSWFNKSGNTRDKKLKQFFLKFCMLFDGTDSHSSLSLQRSWVQTTYAEYTYKQNQVDLTKEYVELMYSVKEYLSLFIMKSKSTLNDNTSGVFLHYKLEHPTLSSFQLPNECITSLMYLRDANHELHHSLLCSFFHKFRVSTNESDARDALKEFNDVAKACSSIFTLYRVGFNRHPDAFYKNLYMNKFSFNKYGILNSDYVIRNLKDELYRQIEDKFGSLRTAQKFVYAFKKNCRYRKPSNQIVKFVLLNYANKKALSSNNKGLLVNSIIGQDLLTPSYWIDDNLSSCEHIAPQKILNDISVDYWGDSLLSSTKLDDIGNLTLLSGSNNASIGEKTRDKLNAYRDLTSPVTSCLSAKVVTKNAKISTMQYHLLPIASRFELWIKDIDAGMLPKESIYAWDAKFIEQRSFNIARLSVRNFIDVLKV